ncbi:hypothetical protein TcG_13111 [Trypanosoma cruzi]|nr:hypothetical protein TcG_13111 [Trypanosoma cruzi]
MAPARMHPSSNTIPRKQSYACNEYECVRDAFNVADAGHNAEHTARQQKQVKQNTIIIFSYLVHRATTHVHKYPRLSAGTHSPHTPLQPTAVYASADAASSSGAHTHAELLRLPSISRRRDGAWVVDTAGASVVVVLGACVVVVVVVVGACVVVVVVVVVVVSSVESSDSLFACSSDSLLSLDDPVVPLLPPAFNAFDTSFVPVLVGTDLSPPPFPGIRTGPKIDDPD